MSVQQTSALKARAIAGAVAVLSAALLASGCGGSSSPGVASLAAKKAATSTGAEGGGSASEGRPTEQQLVAFASCMRSHGVSNFPEPVEGHLTIRGGPGPRIQLDKGSPVLRAAAEHCRKLLPNGGRPSPQMQKEIEERGLRMASCMRSHGVPNFPTPAFGSGGVRLRLKPSGGLDPRSPQFQAAFKACRSALGLPGFRAGPGGAPPGAGGGPNGQVAVP
jgi:hypothetical protein